VSTHRDATLDVGNRLIARARASRAVPTHRDTALTVGAIARELGEPIHRVQYAIKTRDIEPEALAGQIRVFAPEAVEQIADILRDIESHAARRREEVGK
jgi:hypothetical protein